MKKFLYSIISIWFCLGSTVLSQNQEWINYNTSNSDLPSNIVTCIEIDEFGNKWIGTGDNAWWSGSGLAKFDGTNPEGAGWTVYDTTNSDLPLTRINCITIDEYDNKWIGTFHGLVKFDSTNWTIHNTSNSDLPDNIINCIEIDKFGNKWIGTEEGLVKFDGTNWTIYNTSNSGLPNKYVLCIKTDDFNNKWIGAGSDFVKFDDANPGGAGWTIYNIPIPYPHYMGPVNRMTIDNNGDKWISVLEGEAFSWRGLIKYDNTTFAFYEQYYDSLYHEISCIEIDNFGNKWIGGSKGLAKFDDSIWAFYNTTNSGLPSNRVYCLDIDKLGNKWIGTDSGLTVFNKGGIVPVELNSFAATANGKEVTLNWSTATELNNQGFEVQRKFGNSEFATVGSVKGHGTTTSPNHYSFVDRLVDAGKYFYRLKQIDFNGTFEYSNEIEVEVKILDEFTLDQNYPNPFNPATIIKYSIPKLSFVTIKIYDVLGSEVAELVNEEKPVGNYKLTWNAADLPSGVYFYKLNAGSYVETKKMILLK